MDSQKKEFLKTKFLEAEKSERKKVYNQNLSKMIGDIVQRTRQRRDIKVLN